MTLETRFEWTSADWGLAEAAMMTHVIRCGCGYAQCLAVIVVRNRPRPGAILAECWIGKVMMDENNLVDVQSR